MKLRILWFGPIAPAVLAQSRGEHPGLTVEYRRTKGSDQQFDELTDGPVDAVITAMDNVIEWNRRSPESDFRALAQLERTTELSLFGRPGIADLQALSGSRLLVDAPANGFAVALRALLNSAGIDSAGCELVPAGGVTERLEALVAGVGDGTLLGPPFDSTAVAAGCIKLASIDDVFPTFPGQGLVISRRRLAQVRPALDAWLAAVGRMRNWMASSPAQAVAQLVDQGLPEGFAHKAVKLVHEDWRPTQAGIDLLIEHRRMLGLPGGDLGYDDLVDSSLVDPVEVTVRTGE